jgi:peptide deformylase
MSWLLWPHGPYLNPHPILREMMTDCPPEKDQRVTAIATAMLDMMTNVGGVGLAAPQVGIRWRMFVSTFGVFIDPRIFMGPADVDDQVEMEEGCLSFPGRSEMITRPRSVILFAKDLHGNRYNQRLTGLEARVAQHEVDHLNGILFIDHLEKSP